MGKRSSVLSIKIPENRYFFNPISIVIPKNILLTGSPLSSPTKSDEIFEKELDRSREEFNQFNKDLDEIANSMEKLYEDSPEWFTTNIQEIKKKQECIMAAQDKIMENEMSLAKLKTFQDEAHEDINNDLKKIQDQIYELLEKHRIARSNISNLSDNQSRTSEQLDIMLQAIHEYARLIEEASLTIKTHFDDVGSTIDYKSYETLDLSPFQNPPLTEPPQTPDVASTTPTSVGVNSPTNLPTTQGGGGCTGDEEENKNQETEQEKDQQQPIHPLPRYQIKHQKLLLMSMRRAAVGLKFLLYANQLNDYKNGFPDGECDVDLDFNEDSSTTEEVVTTTTYRENTGAGKICVTIRKRSLIVHSYDLLRFDKRMLVKQKN
ncbi:15226_t:CDS:2 [Entrophospora sp. SA101]|nr:11021_t:CDS:2 [Entrophospora sp. SA101]CAJ0750281.1 7462_t:CDS:2 [Entrophospora sp. SA101]CAJ0768021.1 15226_t:CDS:2 [Entrophospora sp. SA101]